MNCRNCNSKIDYNYLTNCPQCGCEVEPCGLPKLDPSLNRRKGQYFYALANFLYIIVTAVVGMVSGAVVMFACGSVVFRALVNGENLSCGDGAAIGLLLVFGGSILGTIAGTAFAMKHPIRSRND